MEPVLYSAHDGIAVLTFNRPASLNAISTPLLERFFELLQRALAADDVAVIVVCGNGRAFCAGDDLKEFSTTVPTEAQVRHFVERLQDVTRLIMLGAKPVVCGVQGWVVGGAAAWLLNADFAVVADDATLYCPEASLGLFPSGGMTMLLAERCGSTAANDFLWRGVRWTATMMRDKGLATAVVARASLQAQTLSVAAEIVRLPTASRQRLKRAASRIWRDRLELALAYEMECCIAASVDATTRGDVGRRARELGGQDRPDTDSASVPVAN